jgi:hypothetical protein
MVREPITLNCLPIHIIASQNIVKTCVFKFFYYVFYHALQAVTTTIGNTYTIPHRIIPH